jgi:hypothetical protein
MTRKLGVRKSSIEQHPQRQMIVDAVLAGRPVREVAASTIPRISHLSLQRFRSQHILPALQHAATNTKYLARSPIQRALQEKPDPPAAVEAARAEVQHGPVLAIRQARLEFLQDRHDRLNMIAEERANDMAEVPGGKSGFLTKDYKGDGREVYKVDGVLLGEMRELEKAAAIETGDWREQNIPQTMIQIVLPSSSPTARSDMQKCAINLPLPPRR